MHFNECNVDIDYLKKAAELGDFCAMRQLWKYYADKNLAESERW